MNPFAIVDEFERQVADFAGAKHAVATDKGTSAIFLALQWCFRQAPGDRRVTLPARTFISVPMMVMQAGGSVDFVDYSWKGVYRLSPFPIYDGALRFRKGMYEGGLHCLSFHSRKILPIGEGGMVLTDDARAAQWLRKMRYCGRKAPHYRVEDVDELGWLMYMSIDKAARGLQLMQWSSALENAPDQVVEYPDLRTVRAFSEPVHSRQPAQSEVAQ